MTSRAAGAYLRVLRKSQGYTQSLVADKLGVVEATVRRWERGGARIGAESMAAYAEFVGGNGSDVLELFHSTDATPEDGQQRAQQWLQHKRVEQQIRDRIITGLGDHAHDLSEEDLQVILRVVRQTGALRRDPGVLHILSDLFSSLADLVKPDRNP